MLNKSSKYCLVAVVASGLLAGCESKSVTTAVSNALDNLDIELEFEGEKELTVVRLNTDEEVILRYGGGENNKFQRALVIDAEVASVILESNEFGDFLKNHVKVDGNVRANLYSFRDDQLPRRYIEFLTIVEDDEDRVLLEIRGEKPTGMPNTELHYVGTNIMAVNDGRSENGWGSGRAHGKFQMYVNFASGTGNIQGDTAGRDSSGGDDGLDGSRISGVFKVDSEAGTFFGNDNIHVRNANSLIEFPAIIYGNFNGEDALGVSGLYVEKRKIEDLFDAPRFYGGISGIEETRATSLNEIRKLKNDYNVVRLKVEGEQILRYGYNESNNVRSKIVIDNEEVSQVGLNDHGIFHKGRVYVGLEGTGELYRFADNGLDELYVDYVKTHTGDRIFLEVGGRDGFMNIPTGTHQYTGTNVFAVRGTRFENFWGTDYVHGTFTMNVDFTEGDATIEADTPGRIASGNNSGLDPMSLSGSVKLNNSNGTFVGNEMVVNNTKTTEDFRALIDGSFHGEDARGVTGLYVEDRENPRFFGAVVGKRESSASETN